MHHLLLSAYIPCLLPSSATNPSQLRGARACFLGTTASPAPTALPGTRYGLKSRRNGERTDWNLLPIFPPSLSLSYFLSSLPCFLPSLPPIPPRNSLLVTRKQRPIQSTKQTSDPLGPQVMRDLGLGRRYHVFLLNAPLHKPSRMAILENAFVLRPNLFSSSKYTSEDPVM